MKKLVVLLFSLLAFGAARAESFFDGGYLQLATGYEGNHVQNETATVDVYRPNGAYDGRSYHPHGTGNGGFAPFVVTLGYNKELVDGFLLGVGADYSIIKPPTFNGNQINFPNGDGTRVGYSISDRYSIFLTPGYAPSKDKLVYMKVGFASQNIVEKDNYPTTDTPGDILGSGRGYGYVLGLGYKQQVVSGFYGYIEGNWYDFSGANFPTTKVTGHSGFESAGAQYYVSNLKPTSNAYNALVGIGYRF